MGAVAGGVGDAEISGTEEPVAYSGVPAGAQRSGSGGARRSRGKSELSPEAEARDMERATTRRMPSDAKWALWQAELETLK